MREVSLQNIPHLDVIGPKELFQTARADKSQKQPINKLLPGIEEAVRQTGLADGMTISFHHHFRNGDYIINMVMDVIAKMGIRNLVLAASSLIDCHAPLIEHIKNGVIQRIETSGLRGELAEFVSRGGMEIPVVFRSHGGRAYAIEQGGLPIDVAFLGAPSCDIMGNANGYARDNNGGSVLCGSLGYAKVDARYAKKTVILTSNLVPFPNAPFAIPQTDVDFIVQVDEIGNPAGIMSGATRFTKNPKELLIAQNAADVIEHSGCFKDGFSMQTGTGGAALAVTRYLRERMLREGIKVGFALGGITGSMVNLYEEGLIGKLLDVQGFDLTAAESLRDNRFHTQISGVHYAGPGARGAAVEQLDVVILSALETDVNFNVNVLTGSDGIIRGAIGGHQDTAYGAKVSIIVTPLTRGRIPCIVDEVNTVITPGASVDVVVTEAGVAVNPNRPELKARLVAAGVPVLSIEELKAKAYGIVGTPDPIRYTGRAVGVVTYRDGSVLDLIYQVEE